MKTRQTLLNEPVQLGLSILEIAKIVMYEIWYDYVKPGYGEQGTLYEMDTGSFIVYTKTEDIYVDHAEDDETRFDTSNYELKEKMRK